MLGAGRPHPAGAQPGPPHSAPPNPAVECVATCEIDLSEIWVAAAAGGAAAAAACDQDAAPYELVPTPERAGAYSGGVAGTVVLTLVAGRALAALRAAWEAEEGGRG